MATRIDYYRKAARCDPSYRSRYYFWAEIGGILFDRGRFGWAARAYKKSVSLGAPAEFSARHADALLHAGDYGAADSAFADYLRSDQQEAYWVLSARAPLLIQKYAGLESQRRAPDRAAAILAAAGPPNESSAENRIAAIQALKQDALYPEAWYLLGWAAQATEAWYEAAWCFTLASVFERLNIHSWTSALLMCVNTQLADPLFAYLLTAGYRIHQGDLYRAMADELRKNLPAEVADKAVRGLRESLESLPPHIVPREIRVLKDDGSFEIVNLDQLLQR